MKLIPKQLTGGRFLPLFADYIPIEGLPSLYDQQASKKAADSSGGGSKSASDKGSLTEKDLFSLLKDIDGLPNEVLLVATQIQKMYQRVEAFGDDIDSSLIASMYAKSISAIKRANYNKKEYDLAKKLVEENKGLNEFAVDEYGKLAVRDKDGNLFFKSVSDYYKELDKYKPITNSNLLWLRAHEPENINANQLINIVSNGIGMEKIDELIRARLQSLGTTELSLSGYVVKDQGKIIKGIEVLDDITSELLTLLGGLTLEGLYKTKTITKDLQLQAQAALQYIYKSLPLNARTILLLRSGNTEHPEQGAIDTILSLITSTVSSSTTTDFDYEGNIIDGKLQSSKGNGKGSGKTLEDEDLNAAQMFLLGYGNAEDTIINPGSNYAIAVHTNAMQLTSKSGENLGTNITLEEAMKSLLGGIFDSLHVVMGGKRIQPEEFGKVILPDGVARSVDFPVDENGNPDFRPITIAARREAEEKLKQQGIDLNNPRSIAENSEIVNQVMKECGLNVGYDSNGQISYGNYKRFAVFNGVADNRVLEENPFDESESGLLKEITNNNSIETYRATLAKKLGIDSYDFDTKGWLEWDYDMFMQGTIWIPLRENQFNAMIGSGKELSGKLSLELDHRQQVLPLENERERIRRQYNDPSQYNGN